MKRIRTWYMALVSVFTLTMQLFGAAAPDWTPVTQPDTITGYFAVSNVETKAFVETDGSKLAVFAENGECRGVAKVIDGPKGRFFSLSIGVASSTEKGLSLQCWDAATETAFDVNDYTIDASVAGEQIGRIISPVVLTIGAVSLVTHTVTFDLGEHGTRTGGGELVQTIEDGAAATAPTIEASEGWTFTGWDNAFDNVVADMTVMAQYEEVVLPSASVEVTGECSAGSYSTAITMSGRYLLTSAGLPDWVESLQLDVGNSHQSLDSSVRYQIVLPFHGTGTIAFKLKENTGSDRSATWTIAGDDGTDDIVVSIAQKGSEDVFDPDPSSETNLTFTAEITGIALVADSGDYDPSELTFVDPSTPLTVPYGTGVIFRVDYDYPDGYSATVWTRDCYPDGSESYDWYFCSNPSAYYKGKGVAYGFLLLRGDIACPTVNLKAVAVLASFSPAPAGYAQTENLSQASVDLTFVGGIPTSGESDSYPAGDMCEIAPPDTTLMGAVRWSAKNLPKGLKINANSGVISGTPTVPGSYVVKVTAKSGTVSETFDITVVIGNYVDESLPLEDNYAAQVGMKSLIELGEDFSGAKATGLPSGLKFAAKATTDKTFGEIAAGTIYGVPSKAVTNCVIFTKKDGTVTHKASTMVAVAAAPVWSVGTFNGRLDDGSGSATFTVAANGKISGKVIRGGKTWSFSASGYEARTEDETESLTVLATAKNGKETASVYLMVSAEGVKGSIASETSADDGALLIDAALTLWRNEWKDKGATDKLKDWAGLYTVQLAGDDAGTGYLSLTLDAKGNCKATGKLPDGTSASATLPLVWDAETEAPVAIWQLAPSAYKGGYVGGLLMWERGEGAASTEDDAEAGAVDATPSSRRVACANIVWVNRAPTASSEYGAGFERTLSADGAYYGKLETLSDYYTSLAFSATVPVLDATVKTTDFDENEKRTTVGELMQIDAVETDCWGNLTISLNENGTGFVVDQGKATKPMKIEGEWSYGGANDAALTFSFTKATGIFRGSFTCWYDYTSATDNTKDPVKETQAHTSKKVSYEGVMVLGASLRGFFLWGRTGTYEDERGKARTYTYRESKQVVFE